VFCVEIVGLNLYVFRIIIMIFFTDEQSFSMGWKAAGHFRTASLVVVAAAAPAAVVCCNP
jgi:hypothetical protein